MQNYKHILLTIDCSPVDDAVIPHVALIARQNGAQVHLLHVVHSHTLDQERVLHRKAERALQKHVEDLRAQGIDACIVLRSGEPTEQVLAELHAHDYDLVAMATHGHTFISDALLGSVSRDLKHKIHVPLLLVRGEH
jgi:universal stress protein A